MIDALRGSAASLFVGALLLAVAEIYRPGFVDLAGARGWSALLIVLAVFALVGALLAVLLRRLGRGFGRFPTRIWVGVAVGLLIVAAIRSPQPLEQDSERISSVIVLGVDGATWEIIRPMAEAGELPAFERLIREGSTGVLTSEPPTLSPRVWTTIATGLGPDEHGGLDFLSTQASLLAPRVWDVVEAHGGRIGLWGWLLTWPPSPRDGFVMPGWLAQGPETWPPELAFFQSLRDGGASGAGPMELASALWLSYDNGARLSTLVEACRVMVWLLVTDPDDRESTPHTLLVQSAMSADLFIHWVRKVQPDLGALVLYATDSFAHQYWRDYDPASLGLETAPEDGRFAWVLPAAYRQADRTLSRLMDLAGGRTVVMVISDHGTSASADAHLAYALRPEPLAEILGPEGAVNAFALAGQVVIRPRAEDESASFEIAELGELLRAAHVDEEPLFEVEETGADFLVVSLRADFEPSRTAIVGGREVPLSRFLTVSEFSGGHSLDGIIGLWGASVRPGTVVEEATLRDIAPTLLALLDLPASEQMTGRVLQEAFEPGFRPALELRRVELYEFFTRDEAARSPRDSEAIKEKLRALGYLQ